jgi:hypothetical protein
MASSCKISASEVLAGIRKNRWRAERGAAETFQPTVKIERKMTQFLAQSILYGAIVVAAVFVYQAAILPGIRMTLRYRAFALRDRLRSLVIDAVIKESDPAFQLLHEGLNYMCTSISRYDLARLIQSIKMMDEHRRGELEAAQKVIENAPEAVQQIYKDSLDICIRALAFNSLFVFAVATICLFLYLFIAVGIRHLKDAFVKKLNEDTKVGFFVPELAAV